MSRYTVRRLTPLWVVQAIRQFTGQRIDLDPCGHPASLVDAAKTILPPQDGLAEDWNGAGVIYVNPPYSNPAPWIDKIASHRCANDEIYILVSTDTSTPWGQNVLQVCESVCFFRGRLKFWPHNTGARFASMLGYIGANRHSFDAFFEKFGCCR